MHEAKAGSGWYFSRYADPSREEAAVLGELPVRGLVRFVRVVLVKFWAFRERDAGTSGSPIDRESDRDGTDFNAPLCRANLAVSTWWWLDALAAGQRLKGRCGRIESPGVKEEWVMRRARFESHTEVVAQDRMRGLERRNEKEIYEENHGVKGTSSRVNTVFGTLGIMAQQQRESVRCTKL